MQFPGLAIEHGFVYSTDDIIEFHGLRDFSGILFVQLQFPCYNTSGYELLWTLFQGVPSNDRVTPSIVHGGDSWLIKTVNESSGKHCSSIFQIWYKSSTESSLRLPSIDMNSVSFQRCA